MVLLNIHTMQVKTMLIILDMKTSNEYDNQKHMEL
jgi:hypothetical protein